MQWANAVTGEKAQFIVNVFRDSLFDFAFDSDKTPILNVHYFCEDYCETSNLIDEGILEEGNIIPLNEEFEYIVSKSVFLPMEITEAMFWSKNKNGKFENITGKEVSAKRKHYKDVAKCICSLLDLDNRYIKNLITQILEVLQGTTWDLKDKNLLYFCLREFISELINNGTSKKYIYNQVNNKFGKNKKSSNDIDYIRNFLLSLLKSENSYNVIIGITEEVFNDLKDNLKGARIATEKEQKALNTNYVVQQTVSAADSFSALKTAKYGYSLVLSIYNACCHNKDLKVLPKGLVALEPKCNYCIVDDTINLMSKNLNKSREDRNKWMHIAVTKIKEANIMTAFELHNIALANEDSQSQFLNLWMIVELLISTKRNTMSRINYISNIITSILCGIYYERIINAILKRLHNIFSREKVNSIINREKRGKNPNEKLAYILKDNNIVLKDLLTLSKVEPLISYKLEYYSKLVFSDKCLLKRDYERHSNRVRWHLMRIYRNRCLIVHNGKSTNYSNNALENLHYYIDEIFNYIFIKYEYGIADLESIFTFAQIKEKERMNILDNTNSYTDEDFYKLLFDY